MSHAHATRRALRRYVGDPDAGSALELLAVAKREADDVVLAPLDREFLALIKPERVSTHDLTGMADRLARALCPRFDIASTKVCLLSSTFRGCVCERCSRSKDARVEGSAAG